MNLIRPIPDANWENRKPLNTPLNKFVEELSKRLNTGIKNVYGSAVTGIDRGLNEFGRKATTSLFPVNRYEPPAPRQGEIISPLASTSGLISPLAGSYKAPTSRVTPTMTMVPTTAPTAMPTATLTPTPTTRPTATPTPTMAPTHKIAGMEAPTPTQGVDPLLPKSAGKYQSVIGDVGITFRNPDIQSNVVIMRANDQKYRDSVSAIKDAAQEFGVSEDLLMDIAYAESKLDATVRAEDRGFDGVTIDKKTGEPFPYSSAAGLFQFLNNTWPETMQGIGMSEITDKRDPVANARGAAWQISNGYLGKWDASKKRINEDIGIDEGWGQFYDPQELIPFDQRFR